VITVLGGSGFIGSHVVRHLRRIGVDYRAPARHEPVAGRDHGHVIYCIGLTGDFRERPYDAVEAHVCALLELVRHGSFDSLLYLSSARVYLGDEQVAREEDALRLQPLQFEDLYTLTKATGEAIALSLGAKGRVARLSNVYGPGHAGTFLSTIVEEAAGGTISLRSALASCRDYLHVDDAAMLLVRIALEGRQRIYNVASGLSVTNAELTAAIAEVTGCRVTVSAGAPLVVFPPIDNRRIREEFGYEPVRLLDALPPLLGRLA
jgi:nucleoside-diphosphate-sugar epimerase